MKYERGERGVVDENKKNAYFLRLKKQVFLLFKYQYILLKNYESEF